MWSSRYGLAYLERSLFSLPRMVFTMDNDASRFIRTAKELFTWSAAREDLSHRIGVASKLLSISEADNAGLAATSRRIDDLFDNAGRFIDDGYMDGLTALSDKLREEIVAANVILDRLKVPE